MNKVLIIVDMLNDFIKKDGALYCGKDATEIIETIKVKLDLARQNGDLVVFLCDAHKPDDKEFDRFPKHAVMNTHGAQIIDELAPIRRKFEYVSKRTRYGCIKRESEYVIKKTRYSGFYNTNLSTMLKSRGITHAEITGVCTNICVMDTVGDLANRDIATLIDKAAVADFDKVAADAALLRMQRIYGTVVIP